MSVFKCRKVMALVTMNIQLHTMVVGNWSGLEPTGHNMCIRVGNLVLTVFSVSKTDTQCTHVSSQSLLHIPRTKTDFVNVVHSPMLHPNLESYLVLLSESHHHLTLSNVTSKLTTLPRHNNRHLATPRTSNLIFLTLLHFQILTLQLHTPF